MMSELSDTPFWVYELDAVDANPDTPLRVAAADDVSLGDLLLDLHKRGRITGRTRIGIMYRPIEGQPGEWLGNPWA